MAEIVEALTGAMRGSGKSKEQVAALCFFLYETRKFSDLDDNQQWALVASLDNTSEGPYGFSMRSFDATGS